MRRKQGINVKCKNIQSIELQKYFLSEIRVCLFCIYKLNQENKSITLHIQKAWNIADIMEDLNVISTKNKKILDEIIRMSINRKVVTNSIKCYNSYLLMEE
jgi:hypothetical protein